MDFKFVTAPRTSNPTSTWTAATVRVRAITGDSTGEWSDDAKIGCDALH